MTTHLYCVLPDDMRDAIPPGLSGLAGAQVRALPVDGLVAWVSDVARDVPVSIDEVRAHDAVVEAALETGSTPVPARYGQRFDDDDACRAALANRADSVESLVADMQGFVEMTLIVTPSTRRMLHDLEPVLPDMVEPESEGVGRRYLEALRKREMATAAIKTAMDELADAPDRGRRLVSSAARRSIRRSRRCRFARSRISCRAKTWRSTGPPSTRCTATASFVSSSLARARRTAFLPSPTRAAPTA